jgi:hypothetical protein
MSPHGTILRYRAGCRCTRCVLRAARDDQPRRQPARIVGLSPTAAARVGHTLATGELAVECWCHQSVLYLPPADIQARRTGSCGRPGCHPPQETTR